MTIVSQVLPIMSRKPDIVLIPGAWHTGDCFDRIVPLLKGNGYSVTALTLPSVGAEPPLENLDEDVHLIHGAVERLADAGKEVVVVMHSYGGIPGTEAIKGLSRIDRKEKALEGGVVALVYMCAWMVAEGESVFSSGGGRGGKGGPSKVRVDGNYLYHLDPVSMFYHDIPVEEAEELKKKLKHHSRPTMGSPITYAAWKHVPTTYLLCKQDQTIPYERQVKMVEDAGVAGIQIKTVTSDASHSPFLSQPDLVVKVIRSAAGEDVE